MEENIKETMEEARARLSTAADRIRFIGHTLVREENNEMVTAGQMLNELSEEIALVNQELIQPLTR